MTYASTMSKDSLAQIARAKSFLNDEMASFIEHALRKAQTQRDNAGMSGSHHDGGASTIEGMITTWLDGAQGQLPSVYPLVDMHKQWVRESDPEYQKYLELKKRFEPNK